MSSMVSGQDQRNEYNPSDNEEEDIMDTSHDFLPPDLAEYLKQAENVLLEATDITSPALYNQKDVIYTGKKIRRKDEEKVMRSIRESYDGENSSVDIDEEPPVLPKITKEEEESVLHEVLLERDRDDIKDDDDEKEGTCLESEFVSEVVKNHEKDHHDNDDNDDHDRTLNLTDVIAASSNHVTILNGNDSVGMDMMTENMNDNEINEDCIGPAPKCSPIQKVRKHEIDHKNDDKDNGSFEHESSRSRKIFTSNTQPKKPVVSPIRPTSRLLQRRIRDKSSISDEKTLNESTATSSSVAKQSRLLSTSRLLQRTSATATSASPFIQKVNVTNASSLDTSKNDSFRELSSVSKISSSSRLLQSRQMQQHSPQSRSPTSVTRPKVEAIRSSSRILQSTKSSSEATDKIRSGNTTRTTIKSDSKRGGVTIPKAPNLSTSIRARAEKNLRQPPHPRRDSLDPNPITRAYGSPTHAYTAMPPRPPTAHSTPMTLTVPKTPNFSTNRRHGKHRYSVGGGGGSVCSGMSEGEVSPPFAEKVNKFDQSMIRTGKLTPRIRKTEMKLTIPKAPKFSVSSRSLHADEVERSASPTFAEVMASYSKSVRKSDEFSPRKFEPKMTVPKSPKFSRIAQRPLPKSSAEREEEMMQEFKSKPFKARPATSLVERRVLVNKNSAPRSITKPEPFRLSSYRRENVSRDFPSSLQKENYNRVGRFRARPMPNLKADILPSPPKREVTIPKAPRLSVTNRRKETDHEAAKENLIARMKERVRQRNICPTKKSQGSDVKPFQLRSDQRHEIYQSRLKERISSQEKAEREARNFKARSFKNRPPPAILKPTGKTTSPNPFHLESTTRHEAFEEEFNNKIKEEEERQRQLSQVKVKPISSAIQTPFTPKLPSHKDRQLVFKTPTLSVEKRLQRRHEFDESIRVKEQLKAAVLSKEKERRQSEELQEIERLRSLPSSQGGMRFKARAIPRNLNLSPNVNSEIIS